MSFDTELVLKLINQSDRYSIPPVTLLTILGLNQKSQVPPDSPNMVVSTLLEFLSAYSRDSNMQVLFGWLLIVGHCLIGYPLSPNYFGYRTRINLLCEGITNAWKRCIEPLLENKDFENSLCVDLLETIVSLSQAVSFKSCCYFVKLKSHLDS